MKKEKLHRRSGTLEKVKVDKDEETRRSVFKVLTLFKPIEIMDFWKLLKA